MHALSHARRPARPRVLARSPVRSISPALAGLALVAMPATADGPVATSFEGIASANFQVGPAGRTAHFHGDAASFEVEDPVLPLYYDDPFVWHVDAGGVAHVELARSTRMLYVVTRMLGDADARGTIRFLDEHGVELSSETVIASDHWQHIWAFEATPRMRSITFENHASDRPLTVDFVQFSSSARADLDTNGAVDAADLAMLLDQFGASGPALAGDLDGDGLVNGVDLSLLLSDWTG